MAHRIGTWGFGPHPWVSVERTRRFYERALKKEFELVDLDANPDADVDAILSFHSAKWRQERWPGDPPIVLAMHGGPVVDYPGLRARIGNLRTSDTLLVNCSSDEAIVRDLCQGQGPRVVRLPLPVDAEVMTPYDRGDCRRELGLPDCDHVVGYVCRLVPQKNLHQFLRAFARIRDRMRPKRVVALVVGSFYTSYPILDYGCEGYRGHIAELVQSLGLEEDLVCFPAGLSDDELAMAFSAMDVLMHPTSAVDENFGYVPVEAMACGVPVVGAAYGGLKDTIVPGETGALMLTWATRSGIRIDLDAGVDAVLRLLREEAELERMSEAAARHALAGYGEEVCGETLQAAMRDAILGHGRGRGREVVPSPAPAPRAAAGLLPTTTPPWESFLDPASHYVSGPVPRVEPATWLRWAAPLRAGVDGRLRLDDPAWPATLPASLCGDPIVQACTRPTRADALAAPDTARWELLQWLVDDGLLVPAASVAQEEAAA